MRRFFVPILLVLLLLSCLKVQRFVGKLMLSPGNSQFLPYLPVQKTIELPQGEFWHNSFVLKKGNREIDCTTEVLSNHLDQSIKKLKIVWIAKNIEPFEKRMYRIHEFIRERRKGLPGLPKKEIFQIEHFYKNLSLNLSSKGLSRLVSSRTMYELQEKPLLINLKYQELNLNRGFTKIQLIEENHIYSNILLQNTFDKKKYTCKYLIFNKIGLIYLNTDIRLHTDDIFSLIEPFSLTVNSAESEVEFFGWDKVTEKIRNNEDYYDYLISEKPESYLFIKYRQNRLKKLNYNYVGNKAKIERDNFFFTCNFDSVQIGVAPGKSSIKAHAALHFSMKDSVSHLSWHWHGFQSELHRRRIRRQRIKYYWSRDKVLSFQTILKITMNDANNSNIENELIGVRDYSDF